MTLPADKYLIEAQRLLHYPEPYDADVLQAIKDDRRDGFAGLLELARALERNAELEGCLNEAVARLAKHEPPVDPDLVLAREVAAKHFMERGVNDHARWCRDGIWDDDFSVQCALAGIKAGRAGGGL